MIKISNLSFQYYKGNKKVIDGLSFDIERGSINVLLGLNGCGKTTLIKLMAGLLDGYSGDIYYNNQLLTNISVSKRSKVSSLYMFASSMLSLNCLSILSISE